MQAHDIKISVCITTRNRARFIGQTLESIISQAGDNIEIVIVDGASTDNTAEVVEGYKRRFDNLVYHREEKNHGVDRDMATCIEMARGQYCWLLSDDDLLKPGALGRVSKDIESRCEIYICNATRCSKSLEPVRDNFWLSRSIGDRIFCLHKKNDFIEYCGLANSIGALFSFWSTTIFKRKAWLATGFIDDFDGSAYAMASTLLSFIQRECRLKYIRDSLVLWRDNDVTFSHQAGLVSRFLLDFDGYLKLADTYLNEDREMKKAFLNVMTREHPWYTIIHVTSYIDSREVWQQFRATMLKFGYNPRTADVCYALGRCRGLVAWGVKIKRMIVKNCFPRKTAAFFKGRQGPREDPSLF